MPERDVPSLTDALQRLIEAPGLRRRLGANAHRYVLTEFPIEDSARKLVTLFREVATGREGRVGVGG
ncbi:MAG: hypothetical protein D6759_10925 [Chloroflexi bacterium]|nr:MAG: hypothetical protein D6759_10925 [Chloroflexota bacterium]